MAMDVFIKEQLLLNANTTLDEVVPHCIKLLAWLIEFNDEVESQSQLQLTQPLVECIVKAHLYLYECQDRFGKSLTDRCGIGQRFWSQCSSLEDRQIRIQELCTNIVKTENGHEHAALLYGMHKSLSDIQAGWDVIKELDWSQMRESKPKLITGIEINTHLRQMRCLVRRICRLSSTPDIEIALQRSIQLIKFDVWLHLFREPRQSAVYTQCYILRHMICDWLLQGEEESPACCSGFVHNIYDFVMKPSNEMRFWLCLDNRHLAGSLLTYVTSYWKRHLPYIDVHNMQLCPNTITITTPPLDEVLYLTYLMLASKSPSRQQFYMHLRTTLTSHTVLQLQELLNKVSFVYN